MSTWEDMDSYNSNSDETAHTHLIDDVAKSSMSEHFDNKVFFILILTVYV